MLRDGQPWFLDYQGGRKGALQYDIASLLYDGKADLPPALRQELLDHYLDASAGFIDLDRDAFMEHYYAYVYVRILQALGRLRLPRILRAQGAFSAKRSLRAQEPALAGGKRQAAGRAAGACSTPSRPCRLGKTAQPRRARGPASRSQIFSFSFHHGMPADESGNGGGFVFDARSLPNPGREEQFRRSPAKTSRDRIS
jgi:hypothetical protein